MDTIFMNLENSKTSKLHILILKLTNILDLRIGEKLIALSNLNIYYTWKNKKSSYNKNKLKISAPTWNDKFELPDGSYSVSDIQDYFEYILKKHGEDIDKPSVQIYVNKIENRVTFKIKNGYSLELLTPETMKLLGSTENKITKDKNGENVPHLEITKVVLAHCNIVNNDYQQYSRVLYTFVPNKPFGSLLEISPTSHIFLKTSNSEYHEIIVWFIKQNDKPLHMKDRINLTMVVENENCIKICVKGYGVLSFAKNMGKRISNKCGQKLLDSAKKSTTDAKKTAT